MRHLLAAILSLLLLCSCATTFSAREELGKANGRTPNGKVYYATLGNVVMPPVLSCLPYAPLIPNDAVSFTVVANIDQSGQPHNIEARPASSLSRCFVEHFSKLKLQPPPDMKSGSYALSFDVNLPSER